MDDLSLRDQITIGVSGTSLVASLGALWTAIWKGGRWTARREERERATRQLTEQRFESVEKRVENMHADVREIRAILMK